MVTKKKSISSEEEKDIPKLLAEVFPLMMANMVRLGAQLPASAAEMTPPQLRILFALEASGNPVRMTELAKILGVAQGTATEVAKRLIRIGHVNRERSTEDDRVVCLSLTLKGREVMQDLRKHRYQSFKKICNSLTSEERLRLLQSHQFIFDVYRNIK